MHGIKLAWHGMGMGMDMSMGGQAVSQCDSSLHYIPLPNSTQSETITDIRHPLLMLLFITYHFAMIHTDA